MTTTDLDLREKLAAAQATIQTLTRQIAEMKAVFEARFDRIEVRFNRIEGKLGA
jgi:hypothetical protein